MDLEQLYNKRIKDLEHEIINLKTTHFKTASKISTMSLNQSLSFSLMIDYASGNIYSTQRAIITLRTDNNSNMINACYISNATPDNLDNRVINVQRLDSGKQGEVRFSIAIFSFNSDDYNTLYGGGSVNLNYTVQLVGSSKFTASVEYRSILGGT